MRTEAMTDALHEDELIRAAFRRWGYLQAHLDPLGSLEPQDLPELRLDGEASIAARQSYCGTVGVEFHAYSGCNAP